MSAGDTTTLSHLQKLVLNYFTGVDEEDIALILSTLHENCSFSVETHEVSLKGHVEITGMFKRLWSKHVFVLHDNFHFVEDENGEDIAVRFQVTNKLFDETLVHKSNCNFFTSRGGKFNSIRVYMSGENTLNKKTSQ